jgi:hypothetical protein
MDQSLTMAGREASQPSYPVTAQSTVQLATYFQFMPSLSGYYLPAGIYPAEKEDTNGVFFKAPKGFKSLSLTGSTETEGGIYLPKPDTGVRGYVYLRMPLLGNTRYELPDWFFSAYGKKWTILPDAATESRHWTIELASSNTPPSGPCKIYDRQQKLMLGGTLASGKMDGTWTSFGSDGTRLAVWSYHQGVKNGPVELWYGAFGYPEAAGRRQLEGTFADGDFDGTVTCYYPSGARECMRTYEHKMLKSARYWSSNGAEQPAAAALAEANSEHKVDMAYLAKLEEITAQALAQAQRKIRAQ